MRSAVDGSDADLDRINDRMEFIWYKLLSNTDGTARAVIRIDGNSRQSFREYRLGR